MENSLFSYLYCPLIVLLFNFAFYFCHLSINHKLIQKFLTKGTVCKINPLSYKAFVSFLPQTLGKETTITDKGITELSMDFLLVTGIFASPASNNFLDKGWVCVRVCVSMFVIYTYRKRIKDF